MKKVIVLILTLALLCSSVPVNAEPEIIIIEPNFLGLLYDSGYTTCSDFLENDDIRTTFALLIMLDACMSDKKPHPEYAVTEFDTSCIYVGRLDISCLYVAAFTDDGNHFVMFTYAPTDNSVAFEFWEFDGYTIPSKNRIPFMDDALNGNVISKYRIDTANFYSAIDTLVSTILK